MANPEHVEIVMQGADVIEAFRKKSEGIRFDLANADLSGANLIKANLSGADLSRADLSGADLIKASLTNTDLFGANLTGADLFGANLFGTKFFNVKFSDADLSHADLSNVKLSGADLSGVKFPCTDLSNADLSGADLSGADLSGADLSNANLSGAKLSKAKLSGANLSGAKLSGADLSGADLSDSNLWFTNFHLAKLDLTNFNRTTFDFTVFSFTNLMKCLNLDSVKFRGPCSIDYDTLKRSGKLPRSFLIGCGFDEDFIDNALSYLENYEFKPIQYSTCFLSHSSKDKPFARQLYGFLRSKGVRLWFDEKDMQGGKKIHEQLYNVITLHDRFLLVISENSMKSNWVETEIRRVRKREIEEKRKILFPIAICPFEQIQEWELFDADSGRDLAQEIREYYIPNFSDESKFEEECEKLLRDLEDHA